VGWGALMHGLDATDFLAACSALTSCRCRADVGLPFGQTFCWRPLYTGVCSNGGGLCTAVLSTPNFMSDTHTCLVLEIYV
jgi:hypothetical protein